MSKAINPFGPEGSDGKGAPDELVVSDGPDWEKRRERAVWYAVAGIGLMFAGSISTALGVGGALMAIFGIFEYIRWSLRRPQEMDPWKDPDIDQWEEAHYGEDVDAPDIVDEEPEEAIGLHNRF